MPRKLRLERHGYRVQTPPPPPVLEYAEEAEALALHDATPRPKTRGDCEGGERPCPWFGCRYHLGLEVSKVGSVAVREDILDSGEDTCALDVAEQGGLTLVLVGDLLRVTRERSRQIEEKALRKVKLAKRQLGEGGFVEPELACAVAVALIMAVAAVICIVLNGRETSLSRPAVPLTRIVQCR